jgi:hypothetical protein
VNEATVADTGAGHEPRGFGWFVLNARDARWLEGHFGAYPASELAQRHAAGVDVETDDSGKAYEGLPPDQPVRYRAGWL